MDKLFLRELKVEAIIGFWDWERRIKQTVSIDLEIATDARAAARVDAVEAALNYEKLADRVGEAVGGSKFHLVETLAECIARIVITEFGAPWVKVVVTKPGAIRTARDVGVLIERRTEDYA
jgi:dihydroneopterin aldolase